MKSGVFTFIIFASVLLVIFSNTMALTSLIKAQRFDSNVVHGEQTSFWNSGHKKEYDYDTSR